MMRAQILEKTSLELTPHEMDDLFKCPQTPEFRIMLLKGFNTGKIDPELALVKAISAVKTRTDLISVALALRYGADPNLYVNTPGVGDIHILAYTYVVLSKPNLTGCNHNTDLTAANSVAMILVATGSNALMPIFDKRGGEIRDEFSILSPIEGHNVIYWLCEYGYDNILDQIDCDLETVDDKKVNLVATYLDSPELVQYEPILADVIAAHSQQILEKYEDKYEMSDVLDLSIENLNLASWEWAIYKGAHVGYWRINNLILKSQTYKENSDLISLSNMYNMLLLAVETGTAVSEYQLEMLSLVDDDLAQRLKTKYEEPFIKKICKVCVGPLPHRLALVAYGLNLDPSWPRKAICEEIKKIQMTDLEELKKCVIQRQKRRVTASLSLIREWISNSKLTIELRNRSTLRNIYDYPDWDMILYRDPKGDSWGFLRDKFVKIRDERINPYTGEELPQWVIDQAAELIPKYIELGLGAKPISISSTLDQLVKKDEINNKFVDQAITQFNMLAASEGYNVDNLFSLDVMTMNEALEEIGVQTDLEDLSSEHRMTTVAVSANEKLRETPDLKRQFFTSLQMTESLRI